MIIEGAQERLDNNSILYELNDAYHIWDGSDDWDLSIKLVNGDWIITKSIWASSPTENMKTYFKHEVYWIFQCKH